MENMLSLFLGVFRRGSYRKDGIYGFSDMALKEYLLLNCHDASSHRYLLVGLLSFSCWI